MYTEASERRDEEGVGFEGREGGEKTRGGETITWQHLADESDVYYRRWNKRGEGERVVAIARTV